MKQPPKLGEVWQLEAPSGKPKMLYLVVGRARYEQQAPPCEPPVFHEQRVLLDLETGRVRHMNVRSLTGANGWSRFRYRANHTTGLERGKRTKKK